MLYVNMVSAIAAIIMLAASDGLPGFAFLALHPSAIGDAVGISVSATSGQWVIYTTIQEFGALVLAACMNIRQICSTLFSIVYYEQHVTGLQVISLILVFGSLSLKQILQAVGFYGKAPAKEGIKAEQ